MNERQRLQALVRDFSAKMSAKLLKKRSHGWSGWRNEGFKGKLENDLLNHLKLALQGDASQWVDVANYAAFLDYQSHHTADGDRESQL